MSPPPPTGHAPSSSPSRPLTDLLEAQSALVAEAAEAIPHTFAACTYALGPRRQAVHLCLTCDVPRGLCAACAVACHHADHYQLELFPKRNFRCDCPTKAVPGACSLYRGHGAGFGAGTGEGERENEENVYGQNFWGVFCRCSRPYDARTERETMVQCVACEDWFHESCLNLRERPAPEDLDATEDLTKAKTETTTEVGNTSEADQAKTAADEDEDDDDASSISSLPPALLTAEDFDALVCASCVASIPALKRIAGTRGAPIVVRDDPDGAWHTLDASQAGKLGQGQEELDAVDVETVDTGTTSSVPTSAGEKRPHPAEPAEADGTASPDAERARTSGPELDVVDVENVDTGTMSSVPTSAGAKRPHPAEPAEADGTASPDAKRARASPPELAAVDEPVDTGATSSVPTSVGAKRPRLSEPEEADGTASPDAKRARTSPPELATVDEPVDTGATSSVPTSVGTKRPRPSEPAEADGTASPDAKRARTSPPDLVDDGADAPAAKVCLAPQSNSLAQEILNRALPPPTEVKPVQLKNGQRQPQQPSPPHGSTHPLGAGDVFLTEGWRERWCRCPECLSSLSAHPYLLVEEETYEPPEDPDSSLSLEELGMRALQTLPRERTLDGIRAFNDMRDDLMSYLRPFARDGRAVSEADVRAFFEARRERDASKAARGALG